ncbi:MAG: T9SS type A sorting domain-containing protein [Prolixibacteraceae bacterium]|nr:T9SS type A sorting domain-containing protein [Prolixibacteraceae bacterium]MBT6004729.1 T9SS type A sorting domain-containing protein [Prolixibacteraceae bacterium]MBT6763330.1 T9SS type A sorting domain-containing protein [Prolixibacteraceae bacterium]MBT6997882.1 T9SS type A sorting domain-containing protein [Prolixibacteraceae bacterium]MBT7395602.1 T9SS type A sorting domain-containing protein [Prolixibacteraceae bacterium]
MKKFILIISFFTFYISGFSNNSTGNSNAWDSDFKTEQIQPEVKLYPNPVKNQKVTIETINQELIEIRLTNIAGKEILLKTFDFGVNKHLIRLENIPNGIYLIQVKTSENKTVVKKLIVSAN